IWTSLYKNIGTMNGLSLFENTSYIPMGTPFTKYYTRNEFKGLNSKELKHMLFYEGVVIQDEDNGRFPTMEHGSLKEIESTGSIPSIAYDLGKKSMKMLEFR